MPFANFLFSLSYNKPKVPRILWDIDCQEMLSVSFWGKQTHLQEGFNMQMDKDLRICKAEDT